MKIIALVGPSSCGKTSTLNIVYSKLLDAGAVSTCKKQEGGVKSDFSDILLFEEKKIAFFTMGDYSGSLMKAIKNYDSLKCDVLVCACNTRFKRPLKKFEKDDAFIIKKSKEINENIFSDENNSYAKMIYDGIIQAI